MPLARLLGNADPARGAAPQARALADRPEPALAAGRDDDERRRLRRRLVRRRRNAARSTAARIRPGTTATCSELASGISSPLFFAHIRASTGSAIQETNTHPFRYGNWLWMHNGLIRDFPKVHRELVHEIDDSVFHVDRRARPTRRRCSTSRSRSASRSDPVGGGRAEWSASSRRPGERHEHRAPDPDDDRDHRRDARSGRSATRARATRARSTFSTRVGALQAAGSGHRRARGLLPGGEGHRLRSHWAIWPGVWNAVPWRPTSASSRTARTSFARSRPGDRSRLVREKPAAVLGGDEVPFLLVQGERFRERAGVAPAAISVRAEHLREVDENLGPGRDVVVALAMKPWRLHGRGRGLPPTSPCRGARAPARAPLFHFGASP